MTEACESCGFAWASVADDELERRVIDGAAAAASLLRSAPSPTSRPAPDVWSVVEYGAHLRDVAIILRDRFVLGLVVDTPDFASMFPDARVDLGLYEADTAAAVADELEAAAVRFARTTAAVDREQLERPCVYHYPSTQTRTLRWLVQQLVHELEHHGADIEAQLP